MRYVALIILLSGCAGQTTFEASIGPELEGMPWQISDGWYGSGGVVDLAIRQQRDNWFCELRHTSNLTSGKGESYVDRMSCGVSLKLRD